MRDALSLLPDVLALAQHHGLLGLALIELERTGCLSLISPSSAADYRGILSTLRRQAALWDMERDAIMARLASHGVDALLLKGAALRLNVYRDPAERPFGDIDILVSKDALNDAVSALAERGYLGDTESRTRLYLDHHHHLILRRTSGFVVEIHWSLQPQASPLQLDPAAFLGRATAVATSGAGTIHVPCPEHMVLHLATQNMEDGFSRLRRLVDIDRVITGASVFDWELLLSEARRMRAETMLALSLRLSEVLLETEVRPGFIRELGVSATARMHLALLDPIGLVVRHAARPRAAVQRLLLLWCIPETPLRMRVLREMATGKQDWFWQQIETPGTLRSGWLNAFAFAKLVTYQVLLYPAMLRDGMPRSDRVSSFWEDEKSSSAT